MTDQILRVLGVLFLMLAAISACVVLLKLSVEFGDRLYHTKALRRELRRRIKLLVNQNAENRYKACMLAMTTLMMEYPASRDEKLGDFLRRIKKDIQRHNGITVPDFPPIKWRQEPYLQRYDKVDDLQFLNNILDNEDND